MVRSWTGDVFPGRNGSSVLSKLSFRCCAGTVHASERFVLPPGFQNREKTGLVQLLVWGKMILYSFLPFTLWLIYTLVPVLKSSLHGLMQLTLLPSIFTLVQWWHQQSLIPHETMSWETIPHQILVTMDAHMDAFWAIVVVLLWHRNCLVNMISDNQWWMHSGGFWKTVPWCNGVEIAFQTRYYSIAMNQALKVPLLGPHHRDLRLHIFLRLFLVLSLTASLSFPVIHIIPLSVFEYWI